MGTERGRLFAQLVLFSGDVLITSMKSRFKTAFVDTKCTTIKIGDGEYTSSLERELQTKVVPGHIPVHIQFLGVKVERTLSPGEVFEEFPDILQKSRVIAHTLFFIPGEKRATVVERLTQLPGEVKTLPQTHRGALVTELPSQQLICVARIARYGYQPSRG